MEPAEGQGTDMVWAEARTALEAAMAGVDRPSAWAEDSQSQAQH